MLLNVTELTEINNFRIENIVRQTNLFTLFLDNQRQYT